MDWSLRMENFSLLYFYGHKNMEILSIKHLWLKYLAVKTCEKFLLAFILHVYNIFLRATKLLPRIKIVKFLFNKLSKQIAIKS